MIDKTNFQVSPWSVTKRSPGVDTPAGMTDTDLVDKVFSSKGEVPKDLMKELSHRVPFGTAELRDGHLGNVFDIPDNGGGGLQKWRDADIHVTSFPMGEAGGLLHQKIRPDRFFPAFPAQTHTITSDFLASLKDIPPPAPHDLNHDAMFLADYTKHRGKHLDVGMSQKDFDQLTPESRSALKDGGVDVRIQEEPSQWDGQSFHHDEVPTKFSLGAPMEWNPLDGFKIAGLPNRDNLAAEEERLSNQFMGSTNFSPRGLRDNWEDSGIVPAGEAKKLFEDLWNKPLS